MTTVTVTRVTPKRADAITGAKYKLTFDKLPGRKFGPYSFMDARAQLETSMFMLPAEARNLLLDAYVNDSAEAGEGTA